MRTFFTHLVVAATLHGVVCSDEFVDLLDRAQAFVEANELELALVAAEKAVALKSDAPEGHAQLANVLVTLGEFAPALDAGARAVDLAPEEDVIQYLDLYIRIEVEQRFDSLSTRGAAAFEAGRFDDAGEAYEDAWLLFPEREQAAIWSVLAYSRAARVLECARVLHGLRESTTPYTRALVAELSTEIRPLLGLVYDDAMAEAAELMGAQSWTRAELSLQDAAVAAPGRYEPRWAIAVCLAALSENDRALDQLEQALALGLPDPRFVLEEPRFRSLLDDDRLRRLLTEAFDPSFSVEDALADARSALAARPLFGVLVDGVFGLIDGQGELVVEPRFDRIGEFSESRIAVCEDGLYGFVSGAGEVIVAPTYTSVTPYAEDLARVRTPDGYGFIDCDGAVVIPIEHEWLSSFSEGLAAVSQDHRWGFLDRTGEIRVPLRYERVLSFREGRACVRAEGQWGVVDTNGVTVVAPRYQAVGAEYGEGLLPVLVEHLWGYVDRAGEMAVEPRYQAASRFQDGLAPVRERDTWSFIDATGATRISARFEAARPFSEGRAAVQIDGRWGFVDREGSLVIQPQFDEVRSFLHDAAWVDRDGYEGWIRPDGSFLWNPSE